MKNTAEPPLARNDTVTLWTH